MFETIKENTSSSEATGYKREGRRGGGGSLVLKQGQSLSSTCLPVADVPEQGLS